MQREERWNEWKNRSCPEIKKPNAIQVDFKDTGKKEKFLGDMLKEYSNRKKYFMGRLVGHISYVSTLRVLVTQMSSLILWNVANP